MNVLLDSAKCSFSQEQLEDLWGIVDDDVLERVAARNHVKLFDEECDDFEHDTIYDEQNQAVPKIGFFTKLLAGSGLLAHFPLLAVLIRDIALGIVRTALHTMDTATGVGTMGMVISMVANLAATKEMAAYKAILT